CQQHDKSPPAF
nr:immunoglobulin light chain junction region [Macaca mulatta]